MSERRIEYVELATLLEAPTNAKTHAPEAIERSMEQFGYVEPIVVDERTGRLVAGHGRLEHLRSSAERGDPPPEGVDQGEFGVWLIPVVRGWASTSDAEAEAYGVAANRLIESGGWATVSLAAMLQQIEDSATSLLAATGFSPDDLDDLVAKAGQGILSVQPFLGGYAETEEEERARVPSNPGTRAVAAGDVARQCADQQAPQREGRARDPPGRGEVKALVRGKFVGIRGIPRPARHTSPYKRADTT